ncbi:MAG: FliA/WhiG family RNA polymerase sigma factor [bacterium]
MQKSSRWSANDNGNLAARDALVHANLNLVHFVAKQLARTLSADIDPDELVTVGTLGLMSAVESFDSSRGIAFSTYAVPRIRGAILDELRRQDHVPRSIRHKARTIGQAREGLMRSLGRKPHENELAFQMGIDIETLWRWQSDIERTVHISLNANDDQREEGRPSPIEFLRDTGESADDGLEREEQVAALREMLGKLKPQQRNVLSFFYFEDLNSREIAGVLGISESRVSQIRTKALSQLRELMCPLQASA